MGVVVVVPMTVCKERVDWHGVGFWGGRVADLKTGELDGVIFSDAPGPANLVFPLHGMLFAITSRSIRRF